ncbi:lyst-interacting protein, putative, partial [Schistosoma mansoni]|uniref:lyst-interacting protein, putative n=1 Tax=Schistosoma mansoni TaxID=6183 RepID=UPI00022C8433
DCDGELHNTDAKKPTKNPISSRKPISFLKRHQGVSAWCSRLKKQGLPVTDPAAELLKRQCTNSSQIPIVRKSALKKQSELSKPNLQQTIINNGVLVPSTIENSNISQYDQPLTKIKSRHSNHTTTIPTLNMKENKTEQSNKDVNDEPHNNNCLDGNDDYCQNPIRSLVDSSNLQTLSTNHLSMESIQSNLNDTNKEAIDLKEFELLEEFAETSSFSNLNTSYISKLYKTNSILDRNGKQSKEMLQSDPLPTICSNYKKSITMGQPSSHVQIHSRHLVKDDILIGNKIHRNDTVNRLTNESHDAKMANDFNLPNNNSNECNVDSILGIPGSLDNQCKVTRFHIVKSPCNQSQSSLVTNNQQLELSNEHQLASMKQFSSSNPDDYDFDDSHSWSFSTSDINDAKLLTGYNLSEVSLTNCDDFINQPNESTLVRSMSTFTSNKINSSLPGQSVKAIQSIHSSSEKADHDVYAKKSSETVKYNQKSISSHSNDESINVVNELNDEQLIDGQNPSNQDSTTSNDQSVLKHWISRLEAEVKRFKVENTNLNKLKIEAQDSLRQLELEKSRFDENKIKERKEFEEYKENEIRKLKKERRVLEEYQRALRTMPNKKDREEIERLKQELEESRVDMGKREVRWHAALSRLRTRIDEFETERNELKGRISRLEEERISLQAKLAKIQVTCNNNESNSIKQRSSSALRQTVNSISQSISLTPLINNNDDDGSKITKNTYCQRSRQLSRTRSSSSASSISHPSTKSNSPVTTGTRESIASGGGYFTGDDDSVSIGGSSERVVRLSSRPDNFINDNNNYVDDGDDSHSSNVAIISNDNRKNTSEQEKESMGFIVKQNVNSSSVINVLDKNNTVTETQSNHHNQQMKDFTNKVDNNQQEKLPIPGTAASGTLIRSVKHTDGSIEQTYSNGAIVVSYANGSVKEIFPDTVTVVVSLFNGDIKRTLPDGRVIYHYAADGTVQITYPNGTEEITYSDVKEILLPNGQREIHSSSGIKCRVYPDGTTKTIFPDGRHETRYSSGRLRVKDANGNLLLDTRLPILNNITTNRNNGFLNDRSAKLSITNQSSGGNLIMKSNS